MSSTALLNDYSSLGANASQSTLPSVPSYNTGHGTPTVSFSILKFDKSVYFKHVRHSDVVTEDIFTKPYSCTSRAGKYCYYYCIFITIICLVAGIFYSGYYVLDLAIIRDKYGHSFNINGTCLCLQSIKTTYAYEQQWKIYNLSVCDNVHSQDYTFWSQTGQQWADVGDIKPCYTNSRCSRLFISDSTNVIIDEKVC